MLFTGSNAYVADNSGGYIARCVKLISRPRYRWGTVGDIFLVSLKKIRSNKKVKKGEMYRALALNVRSPLRRSGHQLSFHLNSVVLLKKDDVVPMASRVKAVTPFELRAKGFRRILTIVLLTYRKTMRPGRPNFSKCWPKHHHGLRHWDEIALRGQSLGSTMPFKSIRWQLRSGDIKGPQDFNLAKMGLFLQELLAFDAHQAESRLHRLLRNRRKLKRAAGRVLAPSRAYHYFS